MADLTDAYTDGNGDVDASVRLAGGLAVEKSVHVKQKLHVLSDEDGTGAGAGAFVVTGGASVNGYVFLGKDAGHSVTVDTDFATTANAVSIAATANNDAGITLASSGTNGLISLTAAETVTTMTVPTTTPTPTATAMLSQQSEGGGERHRRASPTTRNRRQGRRRV